MSAFAVGRNTTSKARRSQATLTQKEHTKRTRKAHTHTLTYSYGSRNTRVVIQDTVDSNRIEK